MFKRAIAIIGNHAMEYRENIAEWQRTDDEYGMNRRRADDLQKDVEELELAIEILRRESRAVELRESLAKGGSKA
jgi:chromosome segregation ATPase